MPSTTFAARAARWSAAHRKAAVLGWLAFVAIAYALGSAAGTVTLKQADWGSGESLVANQVLGREFPTERAAEHVLIESRSGSLRGPEYRAAVGDVVARLSRIPAVARIASPLQRGNEGLRSKDGTAVLVTFQITGDPDTATDRVAPALAAVDAVQAGHPGLFVGEFGWRSSATASSAVGSRSSRTGAPKTAIRASGARSSAP